MLNPVSRTFQLSSGVGPWRERDLWARGIADWETFESYARSGSVLMSKRTDAVTLERIETARRAFDSGDLTQLAALIPAREHWRLYRRFEPLAAFFDLEADADGQITVAGVMDSFGLGTFIRGRNLFELPERLSRSAIWVTFNGGVFDVPILKKTFPNLVTAPVHLDLRFVARQAELKGGLKEIEETLGFGRPTHLKGVRGMDAIRLWREFTLNGQREGLRFLVEYNLYDAINLKSVLEACLNRIAERLAWQVEPERVFDRGDVLYDLSRLVMAL